MYLNEVFRGRYVSQPPVTEFPNAEYLNELMIVGTAGSPLPCPPSMSNSFAGRTVEQKRAFAQALTEAAVRTHRRRAGLGGHHLHRRRAPRLGHRRPPVERPARRPAAREN
jgi:hypothetical protein